MNAYARTLTTALLSTVVGSGALMLPSVAHAEDSADSGTDTDTAAWRSNRGFQTHLGPAILFPTDSSESYGFGLEFGLRYGIKVGPTVLAPGGRVAGYYQPSRFIGDVMPTIRWTIPLGPFAPFIEGGVGAGAATNPGRGGVALLGGGGLMIHFGDVFGLGVRASYETITSTAGEGKPRFSVLSLGPMLQFGF
ncbi:MAG: hypothetical protein EOP08_04350 [Proteobacteria bacterium]|nr:MAG: hypothetical protein EOP08_04350 [Pseudomonadota bacterium]